MRIYLDNAATSFPKAPGTGDAIKHFIEKDGVNLYRTASRKADEVWDRIFSLRMLIAGLYHYPHPECIAFTMNVTEALNMMIKAIVPEGGHVITTSSEHNAVMRPLSQLRAVVSRIPADRYGFSDGSLSPAGYRRHILRALQTDRPESQASAAAGVKGCCAGR